MRKAMVAIALVGAVAILGCVSVERTQIMLNSKNSADVQQAKETLCSVVAEGRDPSGWQSFQMSERMEYLKIVEDDEVMLSILEKTHDSEIENAVIDKMTLKSPGVGLKICNSKQSGRLLNNEKLRIKVAASMSEAELAQVLSNNSLDYKMCECVIARQIDTSKDVAVLSNILERYYDVARKYGKEKLLLERLVAVAKDANTILMVLNKESNDFRCELNDEALRKAALQKLTEQQAVAYVLDKVDRYNNYRWRNGDAQALIDALNVASFVKDGENRSKILIAVCTKRAECGKFGANRTEYSNVEDPVVKSLKLLKPIDAATVKAVFAANDEAWRFIIDCVDSNLAYEMLANGLSRTEEIEAEVLKRVDKSSVDMTLYSGARFESVKNSINASLTPEMKAKAAEMAREAFSQIVKTSQKQSTTTFALDGFYLGMPFSDAKVVLTKHFPQMKIRETTDGSDADLVIYLPGQELPFCYAGAKDKKVYLFNFGKKLLKKWYSFEAQNHAEWAFKYAANTGDGLAYKLLSKDTVVKDSYSDATYRLWYNQNTYQYKNHKKGYRVTYFGEMKDYTGETGLNALMVKEKALKQLRYVRGEEGSLRVRVEVD